MADGYGAIEPSLQAGAVWDYLNEQDAYKALGLTEYRSHEGNVLPFDPENGLWSSAKLPALAGEISSMIVEPAQEQSEQDVIEMTFQLIHGTTDGARGRLEHDRAFTVLRDWLIGARPRAAQFNAPQYIFTVESGDTETQDFKRTGEGIPIFWVSDLSLTLFSPPRYITTA